MLLEIWDISHKKPLLEFLFDKVADFERFQRRCFPVKRSKIKNTNFEEHQWTTAPEHLWKISPLLVLGKPILDDKRDTWAANSFYWKYEHVWTSWS